MKFSNRKKLAMIMTLASVLSNKTSGINKSKTSQNLETVGEKVIGDLKSSGNFSKLGVEKTVLSNNKNIINNKSLDDSSKRLSERTMYGILAAGGAGTAGLGALAYHVAGLLFGNRSTESASYEEFVRSNTKSASYEEFVRSKEFVIKYLKKSVPAKLTLNGGGIYFWSKCTKEGKITFLDAFEYAKSENPGMSNEELVFEAEEMDKYWNGYYFYYQSYLSSSIRVIALRHGLVLRDWNSDLEGVVTKNLKGYKVVEFGLTIECKDKKLFVGEVKLNKDDGPDVAQKCKEFYDDLVKFINNDDFIKKIFLE